MSKHLDTLECLQIKQNVNGWLESDLAGCINFLKSRGQLGLISRSEIAKAVRAECGDDFARALSLSREIASGDLKDEVLRAAVTSASTTNPKSVLRLFDVVPEHLRTELGNVLVENWISIAGEAAITEILNAKNVPSDLVKAAILAYAHKEPTAAIGLLFSSKAIEIDPQSHQSRGIDRMEFARQILGAKSKIPLEDQVLSLMKLEPSKDRNSLLGETAGLLISQNPAKAEEIVSAIDNQSIRNLALSQAARKLQPSDVLKILDCAPGITQKVQLVNMAAVRIARSNPDDALAFVRKLGDPVLEKAGFRGTMVQWLSKDPRKSMEYVVGMIERGDDAEYGGVIPEVMIDALDPAKHAFMTPPDLSKLQDLRPEAKATLLNHLKGQLPEREFKKLQQLLE